MIHWGRRAMMGTKIIQHFQALMSLTRTNLLAQISMIWNNIKITWKMNVRMYLKISKASLSKSSWKSIHYVTKCIQKIIIDIFMPLFSNANRVIEAVLEEMLMNHSSSSFAALFQGHFCHIVTRTQNERTVRLLEATLLPTSIFLFRNSDLWVF